MAGCWLLVGEQMFSRPVFLECLHAEMLEKKGAHCLKTMSIMLDLPVREILPIQTMHWNVSKSLCIMHYISWKSFKNNYTYTFALIDPPKMNALMTIVLVSLGMDLSFPQNTEYTIS